MSARMKFILLFLFLFLFRSAFGLSGDFMDQDHLQTFLIGLKWYCGGGWPFFGPDLVFFGSVRAQIPGALEALLVGGPFFLLAIPEAPFLLLNLLSLSSIALLSCFLSRRLKNIPFLFIFAWTSLLPWTLNQSTWVLNPSYLLMGSVLFFIGLMETVPALSGGFLDPAWAFALIGFGLFWDMQFHFSWILLPPLVPAAFFFYGRKAGWGGTFRAVLFFILGSIPPAALVLPTLLSYGWNQVFAGGSTVMLFNKDHFLDFGTILARYLSLPCYEIPQFIGNHFHDRWDFLVHQAPWLFPFGLFLVGVGWIQPLILLALGWIQPLMGAIKKQAGTSASRGAQAVYHWTWGAFLLLYVSFWFTQKEPVAHIYFVYFPLLAIFSFYVWDRLAEKASWRNFGRICLVISLFFQLGLIVYRLPRQSLYLNRGTAVRAIQDKNYHLLGERRPGSLY